MTSPLRLGIAGLGTVGAGVVKIIQQHGDMLAKRCGREVQVAAISARSAGKDRGVDLSGYAWEDDPIALATRDDVDVFVELIGGEDYPALAAVRAAITAGKHVVTANKALLAHHGNDLAEAAEAKGVNLRFEAAVAGGIPIIKALTEGLAGNKINRIMGVMNGTCNYILTRMETAGLPYDDVFAEADALGFLEADPNLDVGGIDAAHKLVLLSAIAFGTRVDFASAELQGIGAISVDDIKTAAELGYRIKLLGVAAMGQDGLEQTMMPTLVPYHSPLGQLEGGTNMVVVEGDSVGQIVLRGAGAGEGPTASAVMGDIADIARGISMPVFGQPAHSLLAAKPAPSSGSSAWYIRLALKDRAGTLARLAGALSDADVSIDRLRQKAHMDDSAPVVIVTHAAEKSQIDAVLRSISTTGDATTPPIALRIVEV